ncbi:hypothetical protein R5R35_001050 [Gryllus longicercus]|uniref:RNA methyltransferase n=1 Tax=Gryllus longicercus TaxID=2509291 RepID=A0AAN9YZ41_9ORTH
MSSTDVQRPVKVHDPCVKPVSQDSEKHARRATINSGIPASKKNKHDDGRFKFGRKRAQSFTAGNGKFFIPYKKRKRESIVPPTKFLLGGNIFDPLNLNSLQDEEVNRAMNAVTPKSSPLPTPKHRRGEVEVIIPPNINDPLNLIDCDDDAKYEEQLVSPTKKKSKKKKKKRNSASSSKDDSLEVAVTSNNTDQTVSSTKPEENESEVPTSTNVEVTSLETQDQSAAKGKEVRDIRKELDLPLKDDEKKLRKSLDEKDANKHEKKNRKFDLKDKIVSPVIPQPGAWKRQPHGHRGGGNMGHGAGDGRFNRFRPGGRHRPKIPGLNIAQTPKFQEKNVKFQYGNYNRYYGYRNPAHELDPRLKYFLQRREIFYDKDVLDIGCNIGHVTLTIARDFGAKSVVGLDIDRSLVDIARVNVRHYVNYADSPSNEGASAKFFPISMPILYGPVDIPGITKSDSPSGHKKFPHNVSFVQGNYVLESDVLLQTEQPQFDVILALSITKWIHLNWGDAGLKRAFKRMFIQLRPGGKLILEAQAWDSYKKKKKLTETIFKNYNSIEFLPDKFTQYLLSSEVGFSKCEVIGLPFHQSRGFQRPIQLFTKGESPSHSIMSTNNTPCYTSATNVTRVPVYTSVVGSSRETDSGSATPAPVDTGNASSAALVGSSLNQQIPVYIPMEIPEQTGSSEESGSKTSDENASKEVAQMDNVPMKEVSANDRGRSAELSREEVAEEAKCAVKEERPIKERETPDSTSTMECEDIEGDSLLLEKKNDQKIVVESEIKEEITKSHEKSNENTCKEINTPVESDILNEGSLDSKINGEKIQKEAENELSKLDTVDKTNDTAS